VFDDAHLVHLAALRDCGIVSRLKDIDEDGFSSEGRPLNYHHAAADEYLPSVTHIENSGLQIDYGKERILAAIRMPYYRAALTGIVPNAGDCGRGQRVGPSRLADVLAGIAPEEKWLADVGRASTLCAKLQRYRTKAKPDRDRWRKLLDMEPRLFREAGLAILRRGDTPESQVMLTLDYGRSVFHGAMDRNQITLVAFGKAFTQGPGTLYNAGRGGIKYTEDPRLKSFNDGRVSLGHNVVTVDQQNQLSCVGKLLAWSDRAAYQVAVSMVDGIGPGVRHTRGVVLTDGVILVFDRVRSATVHSYDLVYHNFGELSIADGWSAAPPEKPLGTTGNYDNVVDPKELAGRSLLRATWDLTRQYPHWRAKPKIDESKLPPIHLGFWRLPVEGSRIYTGATGLNNHNTGIMSERTPTVIHRVRAREEDWVTVLEPYQQEPRVVAVEAGKDRRVIVTLRDGKCIATSLEQLIQRYPASAGE